MQALMLRCDMIMIACLLGLLPVRAAGEPLYTETGPVTATTAPWTGAQFPITPREYYCVRFTSDSRTAGYCFVQFFDPQGHQLVADNVMAVEAAPDRQANDFYFLAREGTAAARLEFSLLADEKMTLDTITVEHVGKDEVTRWQERTYTGLPPVACKMPADRWTLLPRTAKRLREGGALRIVMLGDSIVNDTSNSLFPLLLERDYPKVSIELVPSILGGTGCRFYQQPGQVKRFVLDFNPDLLIIGGISHGYDVDAIRSVIRQVREAMQPDILVMSGAVCPEEMARKAFLQMTHMPRARATAMFEAFSPGLQKMVIEEKVAFLDMRTIWDAYVAGSGKPVPWFMRDEIHANLRGKLVLGEILEQYFADPPK